MSVLLSSKGTSGFVARVSQTSYLLIENRMRCMASVTKTVYEAATCGAPTVKLFTKEGCTLCDKVKGVLIEVREDWPHTLMQIDITDDEHYAWFSKYKYDIPVLHLEDRFWIKHRTTSQEVIEGFAQQRNGTFQERKGEPDAGAMEQRQAARDP